MGIFTEKPTTVGMLLCTLMMIELGARVVMVTGKQYKVGDSAGWTTKPNSTYLSWASSKNFRVEDVLWFEYNATIDNVIRVSLSDFRSCNTSAPIKTFNSGNDSFTIKAPGHYYFTSGFSGHCKAGQKLDVRVLKTSQNATQPSGRTPSPSPSDLVSSSPLESKETAPSPTENSATSTHDPMWLLMTIGVAFNGILVLVHGCV
ncbi:mavicyanin-like [Cynara cardunculus var. scolymus]|uniref:Cupredoxin n=1 Tax=Cynara cardunculus var. scolymus TaxID=59895 RepID=A0A118JWL7_CYNCS|nr:mavicyanin-like [Cynara cardunculus var. scolymus]KVH94407.1 Cupredoxin [Cynara cardunculus var. scolymus]